MFSIAGAIVKIDRNAIVATQTASAKSGNVEVFVLTLDKVSLSAVFTVVVRRFIV